MSRGKGAQLGRIEEVADGEVVDKPRHVTPGELARLDELLDAGWNSPGMKPEIGKWQAPSGILYDSQEQAWRELQLLPKMVAALKKAGFKPFMGARRTPGLHEMYAGWDATEQEGLINREFADTRSAMEALDGDALAMWELDLGSGRKAADETIRPKRGTKAPKSETIGPKDETARPMAAVQLIPLDRIDRSPNNPRAEVKKTDPQVIAMAETIKGPAGLLEAIVVRPQAGGRYEILAGERRTVACRVVGWTEIPATVRDVDDQTAFEITVIENMHRDDLSPLEEATGCQKMIERGWSVKDIAGHLGRTETWVRRRAALSTLSKPWKKALEGDTKNAVLVLWPLPCWEIIAALSEEMQASIWQEWGHHSYYTPSTVRDLKERLAEKYTFILRDAGWDLDDATLVPAAGACSACPKRSSCRPLLPGFDKGEDDPVKAKDRCMDVACFAKKRDASMAGTIAALRQKFPGAIVYDKANSYQTEQTRKKYSGIEYHDVTMCKKSDPGAKPLIPLVDSGVGTICWGRLRQSATTSNGRPIDPATGKAKTKTLAIRRKELTQRRQALAIENLRKEVAEFGWAELVKKYPKDFAGRILRLVVVLGVDDDDDDDVWADLGSSKPAGIDEPLLSWLFDSLIESRLDNALAWVKAYTSAEPPVERAEQIAAFIGADWPALLKQAEEELPEPKSWAGLKADGTPKGAATPKKAKGAAADDDEASKPGKGSKAKPGGGGGGGGSSLEEEDEEDEEGVIEFAGDGGDDEDEEE